MANSREENTNKHMKGCLIFLITKAMQTLNYHVFSTSYLRSGRVSHRLRSHAVVVPLKEIFPVNIPLPLT